MFVMGVLENPQLSNQFIILIKTLRSRSVNVWASRSGSGFPSLDQWLPSLFTLHRANLGMYVLHCQRLDDLHVSFDC